MKLLRSHPYLSLFLLSMVVRFATALAFRQPGYMDAYYYYDIAENLYRGRGFTENFIWNYLTVPGAVEHASNAYWMPLTSVVIWPFFALFGASFFVSQLPEVLISSALAPLAFYLGVDVFGSRRYGWLMALFTIISGAFFPYFVLPDNLALFALTSLLALVFIYKGLRDSDWYLLPAGAAIGLSYLTRVDGVLLIVVLLVAFSLARHRWLSPLESPPPRWWPLLLGLAIAGLVVSPWFYLTWLSTGVPFASGGLKVLFLREYNDIFAYARTIDLSYYLNLSQPSPDWGLGPLLWSKAQALFNNLLVVGRPTLLFLSPFFVLGLFVLASRRGDKTDAAGPGFALRHPDVLWRRVEYAPFLIYVVILYLAMSLAFTFPSTRGSVIHSSGGLLPFAIGAAIAGIDGVIAFVSRRNRPKAQASRQRTWLAAFVLGALALSLGFTIQMAIGWDDQYRAYQDIAKLVEKDGGANSLVMIADPPGYFYITHQPSIVLASDDLDTNLAIAKRYGVSYLALGEARPPSLNLRSQKKETRPDLHLAMELGDTQIYRIDSSENVSK
jgi:4-amino-4-deoxy-L-arabinose transferase-like glycosyltransferase